MGVVPSRISWAASLLEIPIIATVNASGNGVQGRESSAGAGRRDTAHARAGDRARPLGAGPTGMTGGGRPLLRGWRRGRSAGPRPGCQEVPGFAGEGQPGLLVVGRSPDPSTTDDITVLRVDVADRPAGRAFIRWQQQADPPA